MEKPADLTQMPFDGENAVVNQNKDMQENLNGKDASYVLISETMRGFVGGMPCTAYLKMKINLQNQTCDDWRKSLPTLKGKVGGYVVFRAIEKDKLHIIDGDIDLCEVDHKTPYAQYMHYRLLLVATSGSRYILEGKKIMNPFLFALNLWRESTTLHVTFKRLEGNVSGNEELNLKGEIKVSMIQLVKMLLTLEGNRKFKFLYLFSLNLLRTYILQTPKASHIDRNITDTYDKSYPEYTLHEIKAGKMKFEFKSLHEQWKLNGDKPKHPVLMLNGHSTESYYLPTEPNDLVRTLLAEGHEVWILQSRIDVQNPPNNFTIEDIGRYDVTAAFKKIFEIHGPSIKVHVVGHCVGGLSIHIALMGGHISASNIASLSCTNSAMFFKINTLASIKMRLPLIPLSMAILGENKTLPLADPSKASFRHRLLMSIARFIPRYERCDCFECTVFSGVFGNIFWHQNLSLTMHHWLHKQIITKLPMAAFPHLSKICKLGFIVDGNGNNKYLIHPERMRVSTLYISGGKSILVTPETSFQANKYMKLHQPGFKHERVVVDGFGHNDLLIGEESPIKVFPHIVSHIRSAEEGKNVVENPKTCSKDALDWAADNSQGYAGYQSLLAPLLLVLLVLFLTFIF